MCIERRQDNCVCWVNVQAQFKIADIDLSGKRLSASACVIAGKQFYVYY